MAGAPEDLALLIPGYEAAEMRAGGVEGCDVGFTRLHEENRPSLQRFPVTVLPHHADGDRRRLVVGKLVKCRGGQPLVLPANSRREDRPAADDAEDSANDREDAVGDRAEETPATGIWRYGFC